MKSLRGTLILPLAASLAAGCERAAPRVGPAAAGSTAIPGLLAKGWQRDRECDGAPYAEPDSAPEPGDHVLLMVGEGSAPDRVTLYGIAVIQRGGGLRLVSSRWRPDGPNAFAAWGLRPGRAFTLLSAGRPAGTAMVDSVETYRASATVSGAAPSAAHLATDLPVAGGAPLARAATAGERRRMAALLRDTMEAHGLSWIFQRGLMVNAVTLPGGRVALVGFARQDHVTRAVDWPHWAELLIAEPAPGDGFRTVYSAVFDGGDDEAYTPEFLDVADLDGDGVGEVVTLTDHIAAGTRFGVFRRTAAGWREVLRTGC